jgi:alpha-tubulin suppressor-like RCC1 family protein
MDEVHVGTAVPDQLDPPTLTPGTGTYTVAQNVTMGAFHGASIRYTTNGSEPDETSTLYTGPVAINTYTVLKARAFKAGLTSSNTASATYSFNYGTLAAPTLSPAGTYITSVDVSMSATAGATIRYTTDGSNVLDTSPIYTTPITIDATKTVKARAFKTDWTASPTTSVQYVIKVATPVISLASGTYPAGAPITVTFPTPGATGNYTTSGTDPGAPATNEVSIVSGGSLFAGNYTLKVRSYKTGLSASDVATATYAVTGSLTAGSIASGADFSMAVLRDGRVWGWGMSAFAQGGTGAAVPYFAQPVDGMGLTGIVKAAGGGAFGMAQRTDGRFYVFGSNGYGQLGLGDAANRYTPVLHPLANVTDIAAGDRHALALRSDGTVWAWGVNTYGQLGFGPDPAPLPATTVVNTPGQVEGLEGKTIVAITAGDNHSVALDSDGYVWAWGLNSSYQVGDGTNIQRHRPVRVDGLFGIVAIGSGPCSNHTLAVRGGDRAVFAWGSNYYGTLGDGSTTVRAAPVKVVGLTDIDSVATNAYISSAAGQDGRLWSWGQAGQVGNGVTGGTNHQLVPVALEPGGIVRTSPGSGTGAWGHALALSNDGTIWAWGAGANGDGLSTTHHVPVKITEPGFARKAATPSATGWAPNQYPSPINVGFQTVTSPAAIHYTTDGTEPTTSSTLFTGPGNTLSVTQNTTFKAKVFASGLQPSNSATFAYQIEAAVPTVTPPGGAYTTPVNVTMSSTSGAVIRYTTDNSDPSPSSAAYATPVPLSSYTILKARAYHPSMANSALRTAIYNFNLPAGGPPSFSPPPATFVGSVAVTINGPAGATLRYTVDGSEPGEASATYSAPLTLTATTTLKAKSFLAGQSPSSTTSGLYTIELTPPTLTPSGGSVTPGQAVVLDHPDPQVTIAYTTNGVDPTSTDASVTPGSTVNILSSLTLKARAYRAPSSPSAVTTGTYTVSGTAPGVGFIAAGSAFSLLAKPDGTVWGWGENTQGTLGDGTYTTQYSPTSIPGLSGITWLEGGSSHSVARKDDGTPWTTGSDGSGQLGNGTEPSRNTFGVLAKPGGVDVVTMAAGSWHTLALGADGRVWAWGLNTSGELGIGNTTNQTQPVQVSLLAGVQGIAAHGNHSVAVKADGTVWAWGANSEGQLGSGNTSPSTVPVQVKKDATTFLTNITAVAAGGGFSLALAADGTVWSWGRNAEGELGSGAMGTQRTYAGAVVQLGQVRQIAAGDLFALAVRQDGTVWAWGAGDYGQLGNGQGSNKATPVQAIGLSGIHSVAAGGRFGLALGLDGTVWGWGWNAYGQLGDGTQASRSIPARVSDANFSFKVGTPQFNPSSGSHTTPQNVIITSTTPGATIHYTKTGADPTQADPSIPSGGAVAVAESLTLKARAYKSGWSASAVATLPFSMTLQPPTVTPAGGTYNVPQTMFVSHDVPGVIIRYTTDGSPVTPDSPALPLGLVPSLGAALAVNQTTSYNFRAWMGPGTNGNWTPSGQVPRAMLMKVGTTSHGTPGGVYGAALNVGVGSVTPQAGLYASSGQRRASSSPGATAGLLLGTTGESGGNGGAAVIDRSTTLRTYGRRGVGWFDSDKYGASYFLARGALLNPTFDLGPQTAWGRYLRILPAASSAGFASLRYTLDGSEPTWRSPLYRGPVLVKPGMQFRARSFGRDHAPSASTALFAVPAPPGPESPTSEAEAPTFDPPGGTYTTRRTVTLASATSGAAIHYTTDGTEPTAASSSVASGGTVLVTRGLPLKARAIASGMSDSAVSSAHYRITGAVVGGPWDQANQRQSAMALKTDGTLWGWGTNAGGELGTGTTTAQSAPVQASGLTNVTGMALGVTHGLAVKGDGTVWSWGQNNKGQLGDGTVGGSRLTPAAVSGLSDIVAVAATMESSFALSASGAVYSWGSNSWGELGNAGSQPNRAVPLAVAVTDVADIKAGWFHVLALRRDGTVMAWGWNANGQIGDGSFTKREAPVSVTGLQGVVSIGASGFQSLASKSDGDEFGQIWAWGAGNSALGDDMQTDQPIPVHVFEGAKAAAVRDHQWAAYIKPAAGGLSELWAAGNHSAQYLSPGNVNVSWIPVPLATGNFVDVGGTVWGPVALRWDGTLMHWGNNYAGVNGFALGDTAWANTDHDGDGLRTAQEWDIGTDPWSADTNGDGIADGHQVGANLDPLATDVDQDTLANALERAMGTDAFRADSDGDGHPDAEDAYPLDPTRWEGPPANGGDVTPPLITLSEPTNATLVSVVPQP